MRDGVGTHNMFFGGTPLLALSNIYIIFKGDAPMHTIAVAIMLPPNETHWFRDIGYQHDVNTHCPPDSSASCVCEPTDMDSGFYKLVRAE